MCCFLRDHLALWACLAFPLVAVGQQAIEPPEDETAPAAETAPPAPAPSIPDRPAGIRSYTIERDDDARVVRIVLQLSYPKPSVHQRFAGQGSFEVTIPGTKPVDRLPRTVNVAKEAVSDLQLTTPGGGPDTVVVVRLNTPVRCRAYAVPSERRVIIECAYPEQPAEPGEESREEPMGGSETIRAEFVDTDIRVIIEALAGQSGANILFLPGVSGTYSLSLRDVTLTQALDALWEAWGLLWKELPGPIYLVGTDEQLGAGVVDAELELPDGWSAADAWKLVAATYPSLALTRDLATLAEGDPLPVHGPLRDVGRARRWLRSLAPLPEGAAPARPPVRPAGEEAVSEVYPRHLELDTARRELVDSFPGLEVISDEELGKLTLRGSRADVARARRYLAEIDHGPEEDVEEALWLPVVPVDRIAGLAEKTGVGIDVLYTDDDGSLVYLRGKPSRVESLKAAIEKLREWLDKRSEERAQPEGQTVTRSHELRTLDPAAALDLVAAEKNGVRAQIVDGNVEVSGPESRVERVLAALRQADQPLVEETYVVRYARTQDLLRLVRAAVPELRWVDYQSHRRPGEPEHLDVRRLGPPRPPGDGDSAADSLEPDLLGPSPRLVLIGPAEAVRRAQALLAKVDTPPAQVELTAAVVDLSEATAARLGLPAHGEGGVAVATTEVTGLDAAGAAEIVRADPQSKLLARPTLRTVDGGKARLMIGERVVFQPVRTRDDRVIQPASERVGIGLEVEVNVPGDGTVLCRVHPEISRWGGGAPQAATGEAETTVRLRDGRMVVIAGLLTDAVKGIPALGELLSWRRDNGAPTELVILLSARVLPAD